MQAEEHLYYKHPKEEASCHDLLLEMLCAKRAKVTTPRSAAFRTKRDCDGEGKNRKKEKIL